MGRGTRGKAVVRNAGASPFPEWTTPRIIRFCVLFLALVVVTHVLLELDAVWQSVRQPYCAWLARACGAVLRLLGVEVATHGTLLDTSGPSVKIVRSCDGLNAMAILASGIAAFPVGWRARVAGLALGLPIVFFVNIVRIVVLVVIGLWSYRLFEVVHVYVFQAFIIAVAVGWFIYWARASLVARLADAPGREVRG